MATIVIKRGDTLLISGVYKQSNTSPMDLTGYQLEVNVMNANTDKSVITVIAGVSTANRSLTIENAVAGQFKLMVKAIALSHQKKLLEEYLNLIHRYLECYLR